LWKVGTVGGGRVGVLNARKKKGVRHGRGNPQGQEAPQRRVKRHRKGEKPKTKNGWTQKALRPARRSNHEQEPWFTS